MEILCFSIYNLVGGVAGGLEVSRVLRLRLSDIDSSSRS